MANDNVKCIMFRAIKDYSDCMYEDSRRDPRSQCFQLGQYLDKSEIATVTREEYIALGEYVKELNQKKVYDEPTYVLVELVDLFGDDQLNITIALEKAAERKILRDKALAAEAQKRRDQQAKDLEKKRQKAEQAEFAKALAQKKRDEADLARLQALAEKNGYVLVNTKQHNGVYDYPNTPTPLFPDTTVPLHSQKIGPNKE